MRSILLLLICLGLVTSIKAQSDTINIGGRVMDSVPVLLDSAIIKQEESYFETLNHILSENIYLNTKAAPMAVSVIEKKRISKSFLFYSMCIMVFFFALLKTFYSRYFNDIFRVFFNTSLRQSQITDQLIQAKLPSLFFNIFFLLTGGFYIFLLLSHLGYVQNINDIKVLLSCIAVLTIIYICKYIILKFTGWITGYKNEADTYIFIIYLINKIIAIVLIPVIIIMAFSDAPLAKLVVIFSYLIILMMMVLRFFRSYSILQNRIQVQRLHFFLYIIGIELLPLLLIYKYTLNLLTIYL